MGKKEMFLYLLLSLFSSCSLWRTLWASSSWAVGVYVMSSGPGVASTGSTSVWNRFCLGQKLLNAA